MTTSYDIETEESQQAHMDRIRNATIEQAKRSGRIECACDIVDEVLRADWWLVLPFGAQTNMLALLTSKME